MGPLLDIRHLIMIRAIAECGRVTDAAERLGLTPSALSHRIREAERRLDVQLFTRMHKRLRMTPAAEHLASVAERVLGELDRAEADLRRMNSGVQHVVRLVVEAYSAYHWLPGFRQHLKAQDPGIDLQVMAGAGRDVVQALANRHVDLALVSGELAHNATHRIRLFEDELLFIMPPGHRHADKPFIEGPDIVGETFITFARTPQPDREFARLFRPAESYPTWATTVELPEAIVELVAAGQGTSVLSAWALKAPLADGRILASRLGAEGITVPWHAAIRSEDAASGPIVRTAEALEAWCRVRGGLA
ncbi:MAG: LysR family transcriptional regulator [Kiloniellales bacterium]